MPALRLYSSKHLGNLHSSLPCSLAPEAPIVPTNMTAAIRSAGRTWDISERIAIIYEGQFFDLLDALAASREQIGDWMAGGKVSTGVYN